MMMWQLHEGNDDDEVATITLDMCLEQGGRYKEFFPILKAAYNVGLDDGDGDDCHGL